MAGWAMGSGIRASERAVPHRSRARRRLALASVAALTATLAALPAHGRAAAGDAADDASVSESDLRLSGERAVLALTATGTLDDTARELGLNPDELAHHLHEDPAMFIIPGPEGGPARVGAVDRRPAGLGELPDASDGSHLTVEEARNLHSRPGAAVTILLDLNGHVTTGGTFWNTTYRRDEITSAPYDRDGRPGAQWTPAELAEIERIWRTVAEDFAPFDVDVTTKDPGPEALEKRGASDPRFGIRAVISATKDWLPDSRDVAGVAELGSFGSETPVFAFTDGGGGAFATVGETVSHEVGHALGLLHDGAGGSEYHRGHGGWAPIMGGAVEASLVQWSKGEYPGATNTEDDLAIISARIPVLVDDHRDVGWASTIVPSSTQLTGMLGPAGDVDVFATTVGAGPLTATVRAATTDTSNLFASITVRDVSGTVLATNAPAGIHVGPATMAPRPLDWSSSVTVVVPGGVYTVEVAPAGLRPGELGGFTPYGAHGAYVMSLTAPAPLPGTTATRPPAPRPKPGEDASIPVKFSPVTPVRLLDTRDGAPGPTRLRAGGSLRIPVAGRLGVPIDASAVALNVVAVDASGPGYLTAYPCTEAAPLVATVNHAAGAPLANATIATLSAGGDVCVFTYAETDVVVDLTGWFSPHAAHGMALHSRRVLDTRTGHGGSARAAAGSVTTVEIPGAAAAAAINVTAVNPAGPGYLTMYPCGAERPLAAAINFVTGEIRANNGIVATGPGGTVCIYAYAETDIVVDVNGVFSPSGPLSYLPAAPVRLLDSRLTDAPARPNQPTVYTVPVSPTGARVRAVSINLAATEHARPGFVTTYDCGSRPDTSALNTQVGETNSNGALAPVDKVQQSCLYAYSRTHVIVDLLGWWV